MRNHRGRLTRLTSYERVEVPFFCVLTRIRVRSLFALLKMAFAYRRIKRQAASISGLKKSAFLIQDPFTFFILSIWEGEAGFLDFGTDVTSHVDAASSSFRLASYRSGVPEIWSAQWRIDALGANLVWDGEEDWMELRNNALGQGG